MGIMDLFKSTKELEREKSRARRKAISEAQRAAESVQERIASLKAERDRAWSEARNYLRDGQKAMAQSCLQTVRSSEAMLGRLERKRWMFNLYVTKMEMAKTDQDFASALGNLNRVMNIDADKVSDILSDTSDTLAEQSEIDKIWETEYSHETNGLAHADTIPSLDEMMANLEKEVVSDVAGGKHNAEAIAAQIGEGRRNLQKLLDEKK